MIISKSNRACSSNKRGKMVKMKVDHKGARLRGGWDVGGEDGSWVMGWVWVRERRIIWVMGGGSDDNEGGWKSLGSGVL